MLRNSLNPQIVSSLNPDSIHQTHYLPFNALKPRRSIQRHSISGKNTNRTEDRKQYLSLVSKKKKPQKRSLLKSSCKDRPKRINSVILGGERKSNASFTNTQKSLRSSLCRSCASLHQRGQIVVEPALRHNLLTVQPEIPSPPVNTRPQPFFSVQNTNNQQLNQIISQKLNLLNVQPRPFVMKMNPTNQCKNQQNIAGRFGGKMIRNTSSAGRIYFSVGNSVENKQQITKETQKPFYTPRFDKTDQQKQRKFRKNAGFIRSASAPKISYESCSSSQNQLLTPFSLPPDPTSKHLQITKCFQKMSSIRKEIDSLQGFLQQRLIQSQLKSKFMYNPIMSTLKSIEMPEKEVSFSTIGVDSKLQVRGDSFTPVNSLHLMKTEESDYKQALKEIRSSSLNSSQVSLSKLVDFSLKNQQFSQQSSKLKHLFEMKCPPSNYNANIQKQILTQIASRHVKVPRENQENLFYHKHPLNSMR